MRLLFAFAGGTGHAEPLVPIARAAQAAGHDIAFAGRPTALPGGFEVFPDGAGEGRSTRLPLRRLDVAREERELVERLAAGSARIPALLGVFERWRPDAVVCDEVCFAGAIAAERAVLPYATVIVIAAGTFTRAELLADALAGLRAHHGLPPEPPPHLVVSPVPPSFRDPAHPLPPGAVRIRPASFGVCTPTEPATIYFTLGTAFTLEVGDLYTRVLAGLAGLPVQTVVTVGTQIDPAELGEQPANVRIERFVPQSEILPRSSLVVCHGGSGSVIGALAHGVPLLVLPLGADQAHNAARVEALGAGRVLDAVDATPADVRNAAGVVLADPSYRLAAERVRDEAAGLPGSDHAVMLLDKIVSDH